MRMRRYRLAYIYDNGMSLANGKEIIMAANDRAALKRAREIAGSDSFELEMFRTVKT